MRRVKAFNAVSRRPGVKHRYWMVVVKRHGAFEPQPSGLPGGWYLIEDGVVKGAA
jgi:hypothetical protein